MSEIMKLSNAIQAFDRLKASEKGMKSKKGKKMTYMGIPGVEVPTEAASHVQGMAKYHNPADASQHVAIISHNNVRKSKGLFVVHYTLEGYGSTRTFTFETMDKNMNHSGGMQVYKNHLYVAMENGETPTSRVRAYDIEALFHGAYPASLGFDIPREGDGAGMVGVTDFIDGNTRIYLIAVGERRRFWFFMAQTTTGDMSPIDVHPFSRQGSPIDIKDAKIDPASGVKAINGDYHGIALLTQASEPGKETAFMVGFRYEGQNSKVDLLEISWDTGNPALTLRRCLILDTTDGTRCRFGSGIDVVDEGTLHLLLTERNYGAGYIKTNLFAP